MARTVQSRSVVPLPGSVTTSKSERPTAQFASCSWASPDAPTGGVTSSEMAPDWENWDRVIACADMDTSEPG